MTWFRCQEKQQGVFLLDSELLYVFSRNRKPPTLQQEGFYREVWRGVAPSTVCGA